jgi:hypothetical protein
VPRAALYSLRLSESRRLVTSARKPRRSKLALSPDPACAASRCSRVGCSRAFTAAYVTARTSTAATPAASARVRTSRMRAPSRTAAKRRSSARPTRPTPMHRLRVSCGFPAGVLRGRRAPSGESLGSLGAGLARRSTRVAAAVTVDRGSSAPRGSLWLDRSFRSFASGGLCSGAAGRYQPRFRLLSGRSALLDGSVVAPADVPSASVRRPPRSRSRAPLRFRRSCCRFRPATPFE